MLGDSDNRDREPVLKLTCPAPHTAEYDAIKLLSEKTFLGCKITVPMDVLNGNYLTW